MKIILFISLLMFANPCFGKTLSLGPYLLPHKSSTAVLEGDGFKSEINYTVGKASGAEMISTVTKNFQDGELLFGEVKKLFIRTSPDLIMKIMHITAFTKKRNLKEILISGPSKVGESLDTTASDLKDFKLIKEISEVKTKAGTFGPCVVIGIRLKDGKYQEDKTYCKNIGLTRSTTIDNGKNGSYELIKFN